jgi:hypothetical protein
VSGDAPVESGVRRARFGGATPENPSGEDTVKEGLDEGGAKKVFAFLTFELDAQRLLESDLDGTEAAQRVIFCTRTGFAGVRSEEPRNIFRLGERGTIEHDASKEVGQEIAVAGEGCDRGGPQCGRCDSESVAFESQDRACGR